MQGSKFLVAIALCLPAALAQAAGLWSIDVPADADGLALKGGMWSPCSEPPGEVVFGGRTMPGVKDCPISGDKVPLIVVSHGNGGSFINFRDMAETLAGAGFIVVAINHPGDNSADASRVADLSVFVERPTDIRRLLDFMLSASLAAPKIDPERIGFFGFSAGGYTGLVLAGANPDWAGALCRRNRSAAAASACEQILRKEFRVQPLAHDPRIKAAVIADPANHFSADSFAAVKIPVQLWASERTGRGLQQVDPRLTPESVAAVDRTLPAKHEYHVVPNAGHFAFLSPCPPTAAKDNPALAEVCADAPGFDRAAFHKQFNADVLEFFRAQFGDR
jgi:predicted dienelactone hydrolase